jgi:hypothetical protein
LLIHGAGRGLGIALIVLFYEFDLSRFDFRIDLWLVKQRHELQDRSQRVDRGAESRLGLTEALPRAPKGPSQEKICQEHQDRQKWRGARKHSKNLENRHNNPSKSWAEFPVGWVEGAKQTKPLWALKP